VRELRASRRRVRRSKYAQRGYWKRVGALAAMWALLAGVMYVMIYPLLQVMAISVMTYKDMINPMTVWLSKHFQWQNYVRAYTAMGYSAALLNTAQIALTAPFLQLVSCSLTGYGFARFTFKEREVWFGILLFSLLVPQQVVSLPQFMLFKRFSMLNTYLPMIVPALFGQGLKSGLFIYIFRQFFRGLPKELEDAAYIDGCGFFKTFLRIMLPNAAPAVLTVFLFSFVWHFSDVFTTSMFTTTPSLATLPMRLVNIMGYLFEPGVARDPVQYMPIKYAGIFLTILPVMVVYLVGQRYFVEGVERSGIVG
jgi:multiple sugar transport system permease protein